MSRYIFKTFSCLYLILTVTIILRGQEEVPAEDSDSTQVLARAATIPGDVTIGGLFPVHHGPDCNVLNSERGVHRLEAMLYAVDLINRDKRILPNLTLGAEVRDTCSVGTVALDEALKFVLESGHLKTPSNCTCHCLNDSGESVKHRLAGVVGAAASSISIQVANLLRLFKLPQVSYASTSPSLSDKSRFDFFTRTVPPDTLQAQAFVDILKHFGWSSVYTVRSEGDYGEKGMQMFEKRAKEENICVLSSHQVDDTSSVHDYDKIIEDILRHRNTRVVVLFCTNAHARRLLAASKRNSAWNLTWVASDSWGTRREPVEGLQSVAEGAITVTLKLTTVSGFNDYFTRLKPAENTRNPWFKAFWEKHFDCTFDEEDRKKHCSADDHLTIDQSHDDKVPFVIDAVYAFAHALDDMYRRLCPGQKGLCKAMKTIKGEPFLRTLRNVSFEGTSGTVKFDENGDSAGSYDIMLFTKNKYHRIGTWDGQFNLSNEDPPHQYIKLCTVKSSCGEPCLARQRKVYQSEQCCWTCENCTSKNQYIKDNKCESCKVDEKPNANFTGCTPLPHSSLNTLARSSLSGVATLGIVLTCLVTAIFILNNRTPLVRASGRELMYALLTGILLCYVTSMLIVLSGVSLTSCYIQRAVLGLPLTMCYAALLTKTCRVSRIFNSSQESIKPLVCITPITQLLLVFMICSVQCFLSATNIYMRRPEVLQNISEGKVLLLCNFSHYDLIFSLGVYNFLLVILCTYFAFKTRRTPANFNEARYIGSAMYLTCAIWIILYIGHIVLDKNIKAQVILFSLNPLVNGTTLLVCIFSRKVYTIIFEPTRNSRSRSMQNWRLAAEDSSQDGSRFNSVRNMSCTTLNTICTSNINLRDCVLNSDTRVTQDARDKQDSSQDTQETRDHEDKQDTQDRQDTIHDFKVGSYERSDFDSQRKEREGIFSNGHSAAANDEPRYITHSEHFT